MEPPRIIETPRLRLRPLVEGDIEAIFEYASNAAVTALMDWRRLAHRDEAADFVARTSESWRLGTEFTWAITELQDDFVIGATSIRARDTDADFGYVLNQRYWGRGFATEAVSPVVSWAETVRGIPRIWATCDTENHRSARVLEKLGLVREGVVSSGIVRPNISEQPRSSFVYAKVNTAERRIFDQYVEERRTREIDGYEIEALPFVNRYLPRDKGAEAFLCFTNLPAEEAQRLIRSQIAFFEKRGQGFEWKTYDFDVPATLRQLLEDEGFVAEPVEAFMVLPLDRELPEAKAAPQVEIREASVDDRVIGDVLKIQSVVWGRDFAWLKPRLTAAGSAKFGEKVIYCAYREGVPVGSGWIEFPPDSNFAEIHGGSVISEARGQGIYSLIFRRRALEARRRGYRYIAVDAHR